MVSGRLWPPRGVPQAPIPAASSAVTARLMIKPIKRGLWWSRSSDIALQLLSANRAGRWREASRRTDPVFPQEWCTARMQSIATTLGLLRGGVNAREGKGNAFTCCTLHHQPHPKAWLLIDADSWAAYFPDTDRSVWETR